MHPKRELLVAGRKIGVEFGENLGMLSDTALFMSYGETVVLLNTNASEKPRDGIDFFPLSVDLKKECTQLERYQEDSSRGKEDQLKRQYFMAER